MLNFDHKLISTSDVGVGGNLFTAQCTSDLRFVNSITHTYT